MWLSPLGLNKIDSPLHKGALYQVWLKLAPWFWRRKILNSVNVFFCWPFIWKTSLQQRMLCAKFGWFWRRRFLKILLFRNYHIVPSLVEISPVVSLSCYYLNLKTEGPFFWTNLNLLHPRMLSAKFGWNWPSGSAEEENVKSLRQCHCWQQRRTTDKLWSEKLTWDFGSGELKRDTH